MTITKNLMHTLFIIALIMISMTSSYQLNTMEPEKVKTILQTPMKAEFQRYLLLSTLNNPEYCLLPELIRIIGINVSKLFDKYAYETYDGEHYLKHPILLIKFIKDRYNKSMSNESTAAIITRCLRHSNKALSEIKGVINETVFHETSWQEYIFTDQITAHNESLARVEWINILCLVAGNEAWNLICMQTTTSITSLMINHPYPQNVAALLSTAPDHQAAWDLIITSSTDEYNALTLAQALNSTETVKLLETYRPKEQ